MCFEEEDSWHSRERLISRMLKDVSSLWSSAVRKRLLWNLAAPTTAHMVPASTCREGKQEHPAWSRTEQPLLQGLGTLRGSSTSGNPDTADRTWINPVHPLRSQNPLALVMCLKINWDHSSDNHQNTTRQH